MIIERRDPRAQDADSMGNVEFDSHDYLRNWRHNTPSF